MTARERVARFVKLFDRMRRLATEENPLQQADIPVSMPQLTMLEWVAANPGCQLKDMADGLDVTMPTVSVGVRRLEDAGLLQRQPDPEDGRAVRLALTERSQNLVESTRQFRMRRWRIDEWTFGSRAGRAYRLAGQGSYQRRVRSRLHWKTRWSTRSHGER